MSKFKFIYLLFGIGLLIFIFNQVDFASFLNELNKLRFNFLIVLFIYFLGFTLDSLSWKLCIEALITKKVELKEIFKIRIIGEAFNYLFFQVGGEPVKAFLLKNKFNIKYKSSVGSLILAKTSSITGPIFALKYCLSSLLAIVSSWLYSAAEALPTSSA